MKYLISIMVVLFSFNVYALDKIDNIIKVGDGDTITIKVNEQIKTIRLLDIDCFENKNNDRAKWQSYQYHKSIGDVLRLGNQSQYILDNILKRNRDRLYIDMRNKDFFGRTLGYVYYKNENELININHYMLESGKCLKFKSKPRNWKDNL